MSQLGKRKRRAGNSSGEQSTLTHDRDHAATTRPTLGESRLMSLQKTTQPSEDVAASEDEASQSTDR